MTPAARRIAAGLLTLFLIFLGWVYASEPPGPDQYELQYAAWRVLEGAVPYVDVVDMNWPGFLVYGASKALPASSVYAWRVVDFGWTMVCLLFLARLVERIWGRAAWWCAWIGYPLVYVNAGAHFTGQPDVLAGHLVWPMVWLLLEGWERDRARYFVGAGLLLGLLTAIKPTMFCVGPLFAFHALATRPKTFDTPRTVGLVALWASVGALTLFATFVLVLLLGTPLRDVWELTIVYNTTAQFFDSTSRTALWTALGSSVGFSFKWFLPALAIGIVGLSRARTSHALRWLLPTALLAGFANYFLQGKDYEYHAGLVFDSVGALAMGGTALTWTEIAAWLRRGSRDKSVWLFLVPASFVLVGVFAKLNRLRLRPALTGDWMAFAQTQFWDHSTHGDLARLNTAIRTRSAEDQSIFVWQSSPGRVLFESQRPSSTRFFYSSVLAQAHSPLPMADRWNSAFRSDLQAHPPALIALGTRFHEKQLARSIPAARHVEGLLRDYEPIGNFGDYRLFQPRKHATP